MFENRNVEENKDVSSSIYAVDEKAEKKIEKDRTVVNITNADNARLLSYVHTQRRQLPRLSSAHAVVSFHGESGY